MPQNSIIRADGTGDYTSPIAWEAAEQNSDYGSITLGRLDGFFDNGTSILDINGSWPNGARLEPFDSGEAFDGTERQLCGITTASTSRTIRNRSLSFEMEGLEIYNTSTGSCYWSTGLFSGVNCLMKASNGISFRPGDSSGVGAVGCVIVTSTNGAVWAVPTKISQSSVIANNTSSMGVSSGTQLFTDTVIVNYLAGACFRGNITQSNNASTDSTADTLDNIVVADNFISSDPILDGDYRIKAASPLDTNGIGAFIQGASGISIAVTLGTIEYSSNDTTVGLTGTVDVTATLGEINYSSSDAVIQVSGDVNVIATLGAINYASNDAVISLFGNVDVTATLGTIDYNSNDTSISLLGGINVNATLGAIDYTSSDTAITLQGQIAIITTLGTISYDSNNVIVQIGTGQIIGNVTAGFADNLYSAGFKPSEITVNFKT
tara:strand:+ start:609 stop:1913 length:1305 start_codon:yes stop_codon:yes gene_type:complete